VPRGTLFLVVGPSGAGKDSLIHAARERLAGDAGVAFARRVITRPLVPGAEEHDAVDPEGFARLAAAGGFMLAWRAHDTDYGVPVSYDARLQTGDRVVANVSRTVIADALVRYAPTRVIEVTAPPEVLARRLNARGREDRDRITARIARQVALTPGAPVTRIVNDGALDDALAAFLAAITRD